MNEKFSFQKFLIKFTSRKLLIWLVSTALVFYRLNKCGDGGSVTLIIIWGLITLMYYGGDVLEQAFAAMIGRADLKIGLNAGVNVNRGGK